MRFADIVRRPKYFFFDVGVLNGLLENFAASNDRKGLLFEHLVFNQIVNSAKARDLKAKITYFRTRSGYEVDFILEIQGRIYALEVKSGNCDESDASKLMRLKEYQPKLDGLFIVTIDSEPKQFRDVKVRSLNRFLSGPGAIVHRGFRSISNPANSKSCLSRSRQRAPVFISTIRNDRKCNRS